MFLQMGRGKSLTCDHLKADQVSHQSIENLYQEIDVELQSDLLVVWNFVRCLTSKIKKISPLIFSWFTLFFTVCRNYWWG